MFNIRKKIIERAIYHTKRDVVFPGIETIASVGFVLSGDIDEKQAASKFRGATIQSIRYVDQKRGIENLPDTIFRSDLNFWKLPPDRLVHSFIETKFDILINLAGINNDTVTYICAASKAKFKVCYKPLGKVYDMVIDLAEENKNELVPELINALTNLKSKSLNTNEEHF
jgi:hypothetical protein